MSKDEVEEYKKLNIDEMLKLSQVGSSMDTRFPEDAKPLHSLRECFCQTLISEDKDLRYSYEEADIDDFPNSEDQSNEEINNLNKVALFKTINKKITIQTKSREITQSILSRKNINKINIREDNKYIDIPNLLKNNVSEDLIQLFVTDNYDDVFNNFVNIDLIVGVGDHDLQRLILAKSKNKTIVSGYEHFDLYIDDKESLSLVNKVMESGLDVKLYLCSDLDLKEYDATIVNDIEEAIAQINYNGSGYSSAIFTKLNENAVKFVKEVKSSMVVINASPTIERIIDIKQSDLLREKTIVYPFVANITNSITFNMNDLK